MAKPQASLVTIRCFLCAILIEIMSTDDLPAVRIGEGLYYCKRCSISTGYSQEVLGQRGISSEQKTMDRTQKKTQ